MSSPTEPQLAVHQTGLVTPPCQGTPQVRPDRIWELLTSEQQQKMFRVLVTACRSLLKPPNNTDARGVTHDLA